jgi:hypothetical protein
LRRSFRYTGYYLAIETMEFTTGIRLVADNWNWYFMILIIDFWFIYLAV